MIILHDFRGEKMSLEQISRESGISRQSLATEKALHPKKSYDDIAAGYHPVLFTWESVAKSIGLKSAQFHQRHYRYGLEAALKFGNVKIRRGNDKDWNLNPTDNPRMFSWKSVVVSLKITIGVFDRNLEAFGFEAALLLGNAKINKGVIKKAHTMIKDVEIPTMDGDAPLKNLIKSLIGEGYTGDDLEIEALKRSGYYL